GGHGEARGPGRDLVQQRRAVGAVPVLRESLAAAGQYARMGGPPGTRPHAGQRQAAHGARGSGDESAALPARLPLVAFLRGRSSALSPCSFPRASANTSCRNSWAAEWPASIKLSTPSSAAPWP